MNLNLKEVVRTSKDGDQFWTIPEMYVRGNTIKYLRVPDVVLDVVEEEKQARETSVRFLKNTLSMSSLQTETNISYRSLCSATEDVERVGHERRAEAEEVEITTIVAVEVGAVTTIETKFVVQQDGGETEAYPEGRPYYLH